MDNKTTHTDKLISYKSPMGKLITTYASDAVANHKKEAARIESGEWVDQRGFEALKSAIADNNIDINADYVKSAPKTQPTAKRVARTYTQQVEQDGDINNLIRKYGNAASAE